MDFLFDKLSRIDAVKKLKKSAHEWMSGVGVDFLLAHQRRSHAWHENSFATLKNSLQKGACEQRIGRLIVAHAIPQDGTCVQ